MRDLPDAKIMATGDLNEYKIHELVAARAPIDVFGVGTELATSADAPTLGVVYKMVELERFRQSPLHAEAERRQAHAARGEADFPVSRSRSAGAIERMPVVSRWIAAGGGAAAAGDPRRPVGRAAADR